MDNIYKAFSEVDDILENSEIEIQNKIPSKLKKIIKDNKDITYKININYYKSINEQKLLPETREILAMIYRDYLCNDKEKIELIEKNKNDIKELEEKYDVSKIFEKRKAKKNIGNEENLPIKIEKKKWYEKIISYFKKILKKRQR